MTNLKGLFEEMAEQAKLYDHTERALVVARRRRRMTRIAPVAAAVALFVGVGGVWLPLRPDAGAGGPGAAAAVDWLPRTLDVPQTDPPPLPTDKGVAPASLSYTPDNATDSSGEFLLTEDGKQYTAIPRADKQSHIASISPDGQWLVTIRNNEEVWLRDLTGTQKRMVARMEGGAGVNWSPDGRWLVLSIARMPDKLDPTKPHEEQATNRATVIDMASGSQREFSVSSSPNTLITAVLSSGDLVVRDIADSSTVDLRVIDQAGRQRRRITVDITPQLTAPERRPQAAGDGNLEHTLLPDGHTLLVRTYLDTGSDNGQSLIRILPDDLLAIDLDSGVVTRRYAMPDPRPAQRDVEGSAPSAVVCDCRVAAAALPEGVLFFHNGRQGAGGPTALELLDLSTGQLRVVTNVTGAVSLIGVRDIS